MVEFDDLPSGSADPPVDVHSAAQFERADLRRLFGLTDRMRRLVAERGGMDHLRRRLLAVLTYEPSTRTSSSFVAAMHRLGGSVIPQLHGPATTSAAKGETLEDTVRTLSQYADAIALRHPESGSAERAAESTGVPFLNAGDGTREHPTQALLDIFTMIDERGALDGATVAIAGDLKNGRTVHSLTELLRLYDVSVELVSPSALRLPEHYRERLDGAEVAWSETEDLDEVLPRADVLYMTRIQEERFDDRSRYEKYADSYTIDESTMGRLSEEAVLMHPLPRVGEIAEEVDRDPRAVYFRQARNGMYVRMALLADRIERGGGSA